MEEFVLRPHKPVQHLLVRLRRRRLREERVVSEPVADELRRHVQVLAADASAETRRRQVRDIARERPEVAHVIGDSLEFEKEVEKRGGGGQWTSLTGSVLPTIAEAYTHVHWKINHTLTRIFKAANITTSVRLEGRRTRTPEATFHSLRHTFVSFAANAGVPLHIVQSIVGHESTAMTRHYYHENIAALKSAVAAIPTL